MKKVKICKADLIESMIEAARSNENVYIFGDGKIEVNSCSAEQLEFAGNEVIEEIVLKNVNDTYEDFDEDDADFILDTLLEQDELSNIELC